VIIGVFFAATGPRQRQTKGKRPMNRELTPNWQVGPLPPDTYMWGAVVTKQMLESFPPGKYNGGMLFADFCGDHVKCGGERIEAKDVGLYNNSLTLPYPI
jgi:hypothetical protein